MDVRYTATGKRKNAIACVIVKSGKGDRLINGRQMKDYLQSDTLVRVVEEPFELFQSSETMDVVARVKGGGLSGQAGALRLGVSRALAKISEEYRKQLTGIEEVTNLRLKLENDLIPVKYDISACESRLINLRIELQNIENIIEKMKL